MKCVKLPEHPDAVPFRHNGWNYRLQDGVVTRLECRKETVIRKPGPSVRQAALLAFMQARHGVSPEALTRHWVVVTVPVLVHGLCREIRKRFPGTRFGNLMWMGPPFILSVDRGEFSLWEARKFARPMTQVYGAIADRTDAAMALFAWYGLMCSSLEGAKAAKEASR